LLTLQTQNKAPNECRDSRLKSTPRSKLERKFARSQHQCRQPMTSPRASESIPRWISVSFFYGVLDLLLFTAAQRFAGRNREEETTTLTRTRCPAGARRGGGPDTGPSHTDYTRRSSACQPRGGEDGDGCDRFF
jgi:hypothetical protein